MEAWFVSVIMIVSSDIMSVLMSCSLAGVFSALGSANSRAGPRHGTSFLHSEVLVVLPGARDLREGGDLLRGRSWKMPISVGGEKAPRECCFPLFSHELHGELWFMHVFICVFFSATRYPN